MVYSVVETFQFNCKLDIKRSQLLSRIYTPNVRHLISCMTLVLGALRLRVASVCNHAIKSFSTMPGTIYSGLVLLSFPGSPLQQSALRGELGRKARLALEHGVTKCCNL